MEAAEDFVLTYVVFDTRLWDPRTITAADRSIFTALTHRESALLSLWCQQ